MKSYKENRNDHQLWLDEVPVFAGYIRNVPDNAIIVEIGTAEGGTAQLICENIEGRNIKFYTVDTSPSIKYLDVLAFENVNIIKSTSKEFSQRWGANVNEPVDLIYIDGDHSFEGVYTDFYAWLHLLKKDAKILFHDVDPDQRQGVAHLGVHVFVRTIIDEGVVCNVSHVYRLLLCTPNQFKQQLELPINAFVDTFNNLAAEVQRAVKIVFSGTLEEGVSSLITNTKGLTSLQACYCIEYLLYKKQTNYILRYVKNKDEFLRNTENYYMLVSASHNLVSPMMANCGLDTMSKLSQRIAYEQVKLSFLKGILYSFVTWKP